MAALVVAVNPRVKFNDEQINVILDEDFQTYGEFIDGENSLTYKGLLRTYDDGTGDVDRDFDVLGLELNLDEAKGISKALLSSVVDERALSLESQKKQRIVAWAILPNHGIVFDDMEILIKRLKSKQVKDRKLRGENFDVYSDAVCSRELGPTFCFR